MSKQILWLDNDPSYLETYDEDLKESGFEVTIVTTVTAAERLVENKRYDLLLLDVMIPTKSEAEEKLYPPEITDAGLKTGLIFYRRVKGKLDEQHTPVLVMTVRLDSGILDEFIDAGLRPENFCTKMSLRERPVFIEKVREVLAERN